jgi:uncharacterized protein (DUF2062 family)
MMFKRRNQQPVHHRVSNLIWPRMGWSRVFVYLWHRVARLHGTPHSIAGGLACGAAVSVTPFVGAHFILAALAAWLSRSNIVAALVGTAVGNPWTFPFIWWWTFTLGTKMGAGNLVSVKPQVLAIVVDLPGVAARAALSFDIDWAYFDNLWAIIWPMMAGSVPTFVLVWLMSYLLLKPLVTAYQARRIARRRRKLKRQRESKALAEADEQNVAVLADRQDSPLGGTVPANRRSGS